MPDVATLRAFVFERPDADTPWFEAEDAPVWPHGREPGLRGLVGILGAPATLRPLPEDALTHGLSYLLEPGFSDFPFLLFDGRLDYGARRQGLLALTGLYRDLFAVRVADDAADGPLAALAGRLFESLPTRAASRSGPERAVILRVLGEILELPHPPSQRAALLGAGLLAEEHRSEVAALIAGWQRRFPEADPELVAYAADAARGAV